MSNQMPRLMIYGATGYTARLATDHAQAHALPLILAGRTRATISHLSVSLEIPYRVFDLADHRTVVSALKEAETKVLLNCAGPFASTAPPLIAACIDAGGVHYLDISAELGTYQVAADRSDDAKAAGVMLLPGCGGSVAMLGCLAGHALRRIENPTQIDIALRIAGPMSRGSIVSAAQGSMAGAAALQRRGGELVPWRSMETAEEEASSGLFDFDDGEGVVSCFPVTLPDLFTIWKSTGVASIRTYACIAASGNVGFPEENNNNHMLPDGPSAEERKANPYHAAVVATGPDGSVGRAVLHTVNGYTFTAMASVEAARRVLEGEVIAGLQTPAILFGNGFVETIAGSRLVDLHASATLS
ncbi:hypothetical protein PG997_009137 [Apiospora hydei]|uniref:Saccharopine dehydrogenase NADP binding domain-containing protein n=1 Tax=Apiospora hydei TaxID=1337664 RepID=A0ABR1VT86_9PEZI